MNEANSPNKTNSDEQFANEQGEQNSSKETDVWLTVKEAAAKLGMTERGVQMRAKRGRIRWKLDRDRMLVCLEDPLDKGEQNEQQSSSRTNSEQNSNTVFANTPASDMVVQLRSEVEYLRSELTAQRVTHADEIARRDNAENEYRRLLLGDRQEILRLREQLTIAAAPPLGSTDSAPIGTNDNQPVSTETGIVKRRWWDFWKRGEG